MCDVKDNDLRRRRRRGRDLSADLGGPVAEYRIDDPVFAQNATIEVFGGFYVTDTTDSRDTRLYTGEPVLIEVPATPPPSPVDPLWTPFGPL